MQHGTQLHHDQLPVHGLPVLQDLNIYYILKLPDLFLDLRQDSSSPDDTTVILVNLGSAVIPAVMLSMLYPRRLNRPDMRLKTPGIIVYEQ